MKRAFVILLLCLFFIAFAQDPAAPAPEPTPDPAAPVTPEEAVPPASVAEQPGTATEQPAEVAQQPEEVAMPPSSPEVAPTTETPPTGTTPEIAIPSGLVAFTSDEEMSEVYLLEAQGGLQEPTLPGIYGFGIGGDVTLARPHFLQEDIPLNFTLNDVHIFVDVSRVPRIIIFREDLNEYNEIKFDYLFQTTSLETYNEPIEDTLFPLEEMWWELEGLDSGMEGVFLFRFTGNYTTEDGSDIKMVIDFMADAELREMNYQLNVTGVTPQSWAEGAQYLALNIDISNVGFFGPLFGIFFEEQAMIAGQEQQIGFAIEEFPNLDGAHLFILYPKWEGDLTHHAFTYVPTSCEFFGSCGFGGEMDDETIAQLQVEGDPLTETQLTQAEDVAQPQVEQPLGTEYTDAGLYDGGMGTEEVAQLY